MKMLERHPLTKYGKPVAPDCAGDQNTQPLPNGPVVLLKRILCHQLGGVLVFGLAFIGNNQKLGYLRGKDLTILKPLQQVASYDWDPRTNNLTPIPEDAPWPDRPLPITSRPVTPSPITAQTKKS